MDWSNERYVRLYTRDTADDLVLSWQAMGLWPLLLRKADRAGLIPTVHGARGVAALVRWPLEVVTPALAELVDDGRIRECAEPAGYVIPNYLTAQESTPTDAQRKRSERERRRNKANSSVTKRDRKSRERHSESQDVTPSLAVPSDPDLADPIRAYPVESADDMTGREPTWWGNPPAPPDEPRKPGRASRLDESWSPGPVIVPDGVSIATELERFRDWARANGKRFVDWQAAWRNWVRKAGEMAGARPRPRMSGLEYAKAVANGEIP